MTTSEVDEPTQACPPSPLPRLHVTWQKLTLLPAFLVAVLLAALLWCRQADLDTVSENALAHGRVSEALWQHVELAVISTILVLIITLPPAVLPARAGFGRVLRVARAVAALGRAVPAVGLLALLTLWLGTGRTAALIGMVLCAVLPVLSTVIASLKANVPTPLVILAGVRTALVLNVGTATLAAFAGGGGLGVLITTGITTRRMPVLVLGSVLTVALALLADWLASVGELLLRARGLKTGI
ncbi:ABC transporter permease [Streptomyces sp. HUAS ZL42]|uniref:ABC transporter permease n=1 Tax=Streptomyces sp. HUAS ZL42 TaxID=3231715 RepID=UPI00345E888D